MRTLDTAQADQSIAEQADFLGLWLDEQTLRDEFDAIIATAWPAEQPTRTRGGSPLFVGRLRPRPHRIPGGAAGRRLLGNGHDRPADQHGRERSPPTGDT